MITVLTVIGIGILVFILVMICIAFLTRNNLNEELEFYGLMSIIASTIPLAIIGSILSFMK